MRTVILIFLGLPLAYGCGGSHDGDRLRFVGNAGEGNGATTDDAPVTVTVDTTGQHQTLVGFGAAVAWYSETIANRGVEDGDDIYSVLFPELGLDILRIGNWYQNQSDDSTESTELGDGAIVSIVEKATAALGHPPTLLMSSWSPPGYLKSTGQAKSATQGTLKKEGDSYAYDRFAQWWVSALEAYSAKGIRPDYVSLQNEPDYFNSGWATCLFDADENASHAGYGKALDAVYRAVQASDALTTKPKFVGAEASGLGGARVQAYHAALDVSQIDAVAHHLYNGAGTGGDPVAANFGSAMKAVASVAEKDEKPVFQTEYSHDRPTAFNTAELMHQSLVAESAAAYVYWKLVWDGASADPLVGMTGRYSSDDKGYKVNDSYYAVKHYARWTDPGWVRVDAKSSTDSVKVSAFSSPDGDAVTVVLLNTGSSGQRVTVDSGGEFPNLAVYRTSGEDERATEISVGDDGAIEIPGPSIITAVFTK